MAVLDATADGACTEWIEDAHRDLPTGGSLPFELLAPAGRRMPAAAAEVVLVDTDGNGTTFERIRPLLDTAALALIPVQPARIDVNSLWDTLDTLEALHPHLPALVLLNRADPTTLTYRDTRAALADDKLARLLAPGADPAGVAALRAFDRVLVGGARSAGALGPWASRAAISASSPPSSLLT